MSRASTFFFLTTRILYAVVLVTLLVSRPVFGQSTTPDAEILRPQWSIGDWWEFEDRYGESTGYDRSPVPLDKWRLTVVGREASRYVLVRSGPGEEAHDLRGRRGYYADLDGLITHTIDASGKVQQVIFDVLKLVNFPLRVGKRWFFSAYRPSTQGGRQTFDYDLQAESWDTLNIDGVEVRALQIRIGHSARAVQYSGGSLTAWYAPQAKRVVRLDPGYARGDMFRIVKWSVRDLDRPPVVAEAASRSSAQPASTAPAEVALRILGPAGITVTIDDDRAVVVLDADGKASVSLPPGEYRLRASREGFVPHSAIVKLEPGAGATHRVALSAFAPPTVIAMSPKSGDIVRDAQVPLSLEIRSPYRLRSVEVAGVVVQAPASLTAGETWQLRIPVTLAEGDNTVRIIARDEYGATAEMRVALRRESLVTVNLHGPPGAEVIVDGTRHILDASGSLSLQLSPGMHEVEGRMSGFTPSRERLAVAPGTALQHRVALTPLLPTVTDSTPPQIVLNHPGVGATVHQETILITGLVTDDVAVGRIQVLVNGAEAMPAIEPAPGAKSVPVRAGVPLRPGDNLIEIAAADRAGNVAQLVRTVTRAVPAPSRGERLAVVVGIGAYDHTTIPRLPYAARDAEAMYEVLTTRAGFKKENVILLTDATRQRPTLRNIKSALGTFLARSAKQEDTVVVFFAGHGAPEVDRRGLERDGLAKYLIPSDADPNDLYATALSMDEIQTIFGRIDAERLVMFVDSCYSGASGGRTFASQRVRTRDITLDDQFLDRLTRVKGRAIITAARASEVSLELSEFGHGLFTYYLIDGLRGAADTNKDGVITLQELYDYVSRQVAAKSRSVGGSQHPVMKGEVEGPLPLVQLTPR